MPHVKLPNKGANPHLGDPVCQLLCVGHRRREAHEPDLRGAVDDGLLPDCAPGDVAQIVHLVQDDRLDVGQPAAEKHSDVGDLVLKFQAAGVVMEVSMLQVESEQSAVLLSVCDHSVLRSLVWDDRPQ